jgi:hypothetical protein
MPGEVELGERVVDAEVTPASAISTGNAPWRRLSEASRGYAQVTSRKTIWRHGRRTQR